MEKISVITLFNDFINFKDLMLYNFNNIKYPKELIEWIIVDDSKKYNGDLFPMDENVLYIHFKPDEIKEHLEKCFKKFDVHKNNVTFENDQKRGEYEYHLNLLRLPGGFKRDYAIGLSSNPYILHLNFDCIYLENDITKKINIIKKKRIECLYSDYMITYNIKNRKFGKLNGYKSEACLFHTKEFWSRKGFKWDEMYNEADQFYYGNGAARKYYKESIIQLLTNHNFNKYNIESNSATHNNYKHIQIPDIVFNINNKLYDSQVELNDLLYKKQITIASINSENILTKELLINNIHYLEYNKNTRNLNKITSDLDLIGRMDMIISNLTQESMKFIPKYNLDYFMLLNRPKRIVPGYLIFNNIYIKKELYIKDDEKVDDETKVDDEKKDEETKVDVKL